jgi:hypothetical protein
MPRTRYYLRIPTIPALTRMPTLAAWRDDALCNGHPHPEWWDDSTGDEDKHENKAAREARTWRAKTVCGNCPVKAECWADVDLDYDEGVRAGQDLREVRREIKKGKAS